MSTLTAENFAWVVSIAGLGRVGEDAPGLGRAAVTPLPLANANIQPSTSLFEDTYCVCLRQVRFSARSFSPVSGEVESMDVELTFDLPDATHPEIAKFFGAARAARRPETNLGAGVTVSPTTTAVNLVTGGGGGLSADDIVHFGRESVRVATTTPSAFTIVDAIPNGSGGTVLRSTSSATSYPIGHFGTQRATHEGRSSGDEWPYNDDRVWTHTPFLHGREVILYKSDGDGLEEVFDRFVLWGRPRFSDGNTQVTIKAVGLVGAMGDRVLNARANKYVVAEQYHIGEYRLVEPSKSDVERARDAIWSSGDRGVFQIGDCISVFAVSDDPAGGIRLSAPGVPAPLWRSKPLKEDEDLTGEDVFEVLVTDPLDGSASDPPLQMITASNHPYYSTDLVDPDTSAPRVANHPVEQMLCHLGAIDSSLPEHLRADLPPESINTDSIVRTLKSQLEFARPWYGDLDCVDGKPIKSALDWLQKRKLRPIGASFSHDSDGKLIIRTMWDAVATSSITAARLLPGRGGDIDDGLAVDAVAVLTGRGAGKQPMLTIRSDSYYDATLYPLGQQLIEIEAEGFMHPDQVSLALRDDPRVIGYRAHLLSIGELFRLPPVALKLRVTGSDRLSEGAFYTFAAAGFRDDETGVVPTTDDSFVGLVVKVAPHADRAMTQDVIALRMPFDANRIGPAVNVTARNSATEIEVENAYFVEELEGGTYDVAEKSVDQDVDQFELGQVCVIVDANREAKTQTFILKSINAAASPPTMTATADILLTGGGAYSWADGDRVTLADYSDANAAEQSTYAHMDSGQTYSA